MHGARGARAAAFALSDLAVATMLRGDTADAVRQHEEALALTDDDGDPWSRAHCLWGLGVARWLCGALDEAEDAERAALALVGRSGERSGIALCLEALAWVAASRQEFERAARLQGASASAWRSIPASLPPPLRAHARRCAQQTRERVGTQRRDRLYAAGRQLDRPAAVALGMGQDGSDVQAAPTQRAAGLLSARELQVARLVAEGLTDREIAGRLVIAPRTAESHVQHIRTKLGFRSRAQVAAWVSTAPDSRDG